MSDLVVFKVKAIWRLSCEELFSHVITSWKSIDRFKDETVMFQNNFQTANIHEKNVVSNVVGSILSVPMIL